MALMITNFLKPEFLYPGHCFLLSSWYIKFFLPYPLKAQETNGARFFKASGIECRWVGVGGWGVICESHKGDFLKEIKVARSINAIKRTYVIE